MQDFSVHRRISFSTNGHASGPSRETPGIKVDRRDVSKKVRALTDVKLPKTLFYQRGQAERERELNSWNKDEDRTRSPGTIQRLECCVDISLSYPRLSRSTLQDNAKLSSYQKRVVELEMPKVNSPLFRAAVLALNLSISLCVLRLSC